MELLNSIESVLVTITAAAAVGLGLRGLARASDAAVGERTWSAVAVAILLVVAAVAGMGGARGF